MKSDVDSDSVTQARINRRRHSSDLLEANGSEFVEHDEDPYAVDKPFPPLIPKISWTFVVLILFTIGSCLGIIFGLPSVVDRSRTKLLEYYSVPFVSVVFTYFHIWLALWMTFYPVRFYGCLQLKGEVFGNVGLPGWQGIIPFKAEKMARTAVRLMTSKLLNVKAIFQRVDAMQAAEQLIPLVQTHTRELVDLIAVKYYPALWNVLPAAVKDELMMKIVEDAPPTVAKMIEDFKENVEDIVDLEALIVKHTKERPELLIRMFINCGYSELKFIRDTGATMGFLFGVLQLGLYLGLEAGGAQTSFNKYIVFPVFGLVVGSLTNYIALAVIFKPVNPIYVCGVKLHGLFLQHQAEVAKEYSRLCARDFLNPKNVTDAIVKGKSELLLDLIAGHVDIAVDKHFGSLQPIVRVAMGTDDFELMKMEFARKIVDLIPETVMHVEEYLYESLAIQKTLEDSVAAISYYDFEQLLHPVFQEDEWKLILLGGILGVVIGCIQMTFLD